MRAGHVKETVLAADTVKGSKERSLATHRPHLARLSKQCHILVETSGDQSGNSCHSLVDLCCGVNRCQR